MTAAVVPHKERKKLFSSTQSLVLYFLVGSIGTIFDAYSSWQIIEVNPIAIEGNPIWSSIANTVGFGMTMVIRAVLGVAMLGILFFLSNQKWHLGARKYARFGLRLVAIVLAVLSAYHILAVALFG